MVKEEGPTLAPLTVFEIAGRRVVLDGHCRLAAYRGAGIEEKAQVPVEHFRGTFAEALVFSIEANSQDKLPLSLTEKLEHAWKLVKFSERRSCYSKREISRKAGVSDSTVAEMRRTLTEDLGFDPREEETWVDVKKKRRASEDHGDDWKEQQIERVATRFRKAFGPYPDKQPDLFFGGLSRAYPRFVEEFLEPKGEGEEDLF